MPERIWVCRVFLELVFGIVCHAERYTSCTSGQGGAGVKAVGRRVVFAMLLVTALASVFAVQQEKNRELRAVFSQRGNRQVKVIAHRGGAASAPENTLAALERAVAAGADWAEIDLRMTKDGEVVALHDPTLNRTTGVKGAVSELNLRAVRELDAGDWFSPDFEGERVPTLTEILDTARGRIGLMLELKHTPSDHLVLEKVVAQIRAKGMEETCMVASAALELLLRCKELAPSIQTVYIGEDTMPELWSLHYVDGYSISVSGLTAWDVERAHREGRELYVWTVNEMEELEAALALGVDGLVSDDPILVLEVLDRSAAMEGRHVCP